MKRKRRIEQLEAAVNALVAPEQQQQGAGIDTSPERRAEVLQGLIVAGALARGCTGKALEVRRLLLEAGEVTEAQLEGRRVFGWRGT
jgi:hypothetical protein